MKLSNRDKHKLAVKLLSDHLIKKGYEHLVLSSGDDFDVYVPSSKTRIKIFCNYAGVNNVTINRNFESEEGILYLVIKPTKNNAHGFSCVGGDKLVIDKAVKNFNTKGSPKNILSDRLKFISISKYIDNERAIADKEASIEPEQPAFTSVLPNIIQQSNVKMCRTPTVYSFIHEIRSLSHIAQH